MPNTPVVRFAETGGPEVLQITEVELAEPGPGQALIAVHASGVNFIDTYHRSGLYPVDLPFIPGSEGAGIVEAVGADVTDVAVGDRVAWVGVPGSYAGRVLAPTEALMPVPDGVSLKIAAALPLQGMTAHYLVSDTKPLRPGDRCLIHAAAGGTGRLLVQMANIRGAEVVATAGSPEKGELARAAGAAHVVFDGVGAATFDAGLHLLAPRGTMATFGNASGAVPPISPLALMAKSLFLTRPTLITHIATPEARFARWNELNRWIANGDLEVRVGHTFPLTDAAAAHTALEARSTTGKILLLP